ncbi:MAG: LysR family transcriptional regulator [Steroidobacteraceae bacterium]
MDRLSGIKAFLEVVGSGSFVAAAERLDVSTATVSKHVLHLEQRLGVRLLNRNSHSPSPTEPGRIYFERCKVIFEDLEGTELELDSLGATPRGTLRVTCPSWFASRRMATLIEQYRESHPRIVVDVSFEDRFIDLVEDGYDLALRVSSGLGSLPAGLVAYPMRSLPFLVAASREYIRRNGTPSSPEDLAMHDCIAVGAMDAWVFEGPNGRTEVPAKIVQRVRSTAAAPYVVAAGVGLAPLPLTIFEEPAFRDVLIPVLTEYPLRQTALYTVYVTRRYVPLKIRSFIDFLVESVAEMHQPAWRPPAARRLLR